MDLQLLANEAFAAIKANAGEEFPHSTVKEAFDSFRAIVAERGIVWLIDSASGSGMSHLGWTGWMSEARKSLGM